MIHVPRNSPSQICPILKNEMSDIIRVSKRSYLDCLSLVMYLLRLKFPKTSGICSTRQRPNWQRDSNGHSHISKNPVMPQYHKYNQIFNFFPQFNYSILFFFFQWINLPSIQILFFLFIQRIISLQIKRNNRSLEWLNC